MAAEVAAAAAMRLISTHVRVLGESFVPAVPAPAAAVSSDAVADADTAIGATTAAPAERFFPTYIRAWGPGRKPGASSFTRCPSLYICASRSTTPAEGGHRQGDGGGTERAVSHP